MRSSLLRTNLPYDQRLRNEIQRSPASGAEVFFDPLFFGWRPADPDNGLFLRWRCSCVATRSKVAQPASFPTPARSVSLTLLPPPHNRSQQSPTMGIQLHAGQLRYHVSGFGFISAPFTFRRVPLSTRRRRAAERAFFFPFLTQHTFVRSVPFRRTFPSLGKPILQDNNGCRCCHSHYRLCGTYRRILLCSYVNNSNNVVSS